MYSKTDEVVVFIAAALVVAATWYLAVKVHPLALAIGAAVLILGFAG